MVTQRDYAPDYSAIPPHGRWQHFDVGGRPRIDEMMKCWPSDVDTAERTRRLIDLFLVSVLLDAGAGTKWQYKSNVNGKFYRRSEGLAIASLEMFRTGLFSSNPSQKEQVDGEATCLPKYDLLTVLLGMALKSLTIDTLRNGLQVTPENPLAGLEGRSGLLIKLGEALDNQDFFGVDSRPGNMLGEFIFYCNLYVLYILLFPRLLDTTPNDPKTRRKSCHTRSNSMDSAHGWVGTHLAAVAHSSRWYLNR